MPRCDLCGVKLIRINGRWFCVNHGFVEINDEEEYEESNSEFRSYIG